MLLASPADAVATPTLSATVIDGASAYSPTQLFAVYRDQLGRPITSASAQAIVAQIEAMYMRDGYPRPEFRLDGGLAADGILRVQVFEAQVTQVVFSGDPGPYGDKLDDMATQVRGQVPLRIVQLQAALQKMRELPGLEIKATTRRDETRRNGYILDVQADFKPVEAVVEFSNRGTRQVGPKFVFGQVVGNNVFGREERIGLLFSAASDYEEFRGAGLFFDLPVSEQGTHLTATTFGYHANPSELPDRDDLYERQRTALRVTRPIDLAAPLKFALSAGLDFDDQQISRSGLLLRDEKLRIAEIGARLSGRSGANSQYLVALQVRQGLDALGGKLEARDLLHDQRREDFLLTRVQFTHLTQFAPRWTLRFDALGQQSAYVLPDAERYKIGGERLGRGFEVAEIAGDQGIGAKAELRRELTGAAAAFGKTSLYGFYDFAAAWKQNISDRESAATSGIGFAIEYGRLSGFVEVAKPLTHADVEGDRDTSVFAELRVKL